MSADPTVKAGKKCTCSWHPASSHRATGLHLIRPITGIYKGDGSSITTLQNLGHKSRWPVSLRTRPASPSQVRGILHLPELTENMIHVCGTATQLPERCCVATSARTNPSAESLKQLSLPIFRWTAASPGQQGVQCGHSSLPLLSGPWALGKGLAGDPSAISAQLHRPCSCDAPHASKTARAVATETSLIMQMSLGVQNDSISPIMST